MGIEKLMPAQQERLYEIDEFERLLQAPENRERLLELIDGEIAEKMPTEEHGEIAALIAAALIAFTRPQKLGRVGVEVRHKMPNDDRNSRLPDVSFIAGQRPRVTDGSVPQMPDLAIEVKSPDDSLKHLRERADYYLLNGARMVWLADPAKRLVIVMTADEEAILLEHETLDGGDVLPGFTLPLREIFSDPLA